ncbi:MAG: DNA primase [Chitinispirillales bacterium]|jgi:DNA primase|nr:DNA primase [Chitinispirillales bacterium]
MNERFDDSVKEQIRMRADIASVVGRYVNLKGSGQTLKGLCPFHKEKTPSFHINADRGFYYCYGCNKGGDVFSFLQEIEKVDFPEALRMLADETGVALEPPRRQQNTPSLITFKNTSKTELIEIHAIAAQFYYNLVKNTPDAVQYFKSRGLKAETVKEFCLGYAPSGWSALIDYMQSKNIGADKLAECGLVIKKESGGLYDRFRNRVMFPLYNQSGRIIAFAGRGLNKETQPKYLNSPETALYQKSGLLYGIHKSRQSIRDQGLLLIVEGYMDHLTLYQAGIRNVAATSGTAFTSEHASLIQRLAPKVTLVFDGDRAGLAAAQKAVFVLAPFNLQVSVLVLPGEDDPDSFVKREGAEIFLEMIKSAKNSTVFLIDKLISEQGDSPQAKRNIIEELAPYVQSIKDPIVRDDFLIKLASKLRVDSRHVFNRFSNENSCSRNAQPINIQQLNLNIKEKLGKLEESFLRILLTSPELISLAKRYVSPQTLTDSLSANIYSIIVETFDASGNLDGLSGALPDNSEIKRIISMLTVKPALKENINAELEQKIILLRRKSLMAELRQLREKLDAESGEAEKLQLLQRHRECTAQLKELDE